MMTASVSGVKREPILLTTSTFPRWEGDELPPFVFELARSLSETFDVHVLTPHSPGSLTLEGMGGVTVHRYRYLPGRLEVFSGQAILPGLRRNPLLWLGLPFLLLGQLLSVLLLCRRLGIRRVHAHWSVPQGLVAVLCRRVLGARIRVLITAHGSDVLALRGRPMRALNRWIMDGADALTVVSRALADEVRRLGVREDLPVEVLPMGVDFSLFSPRSRNASLRERYHVTGPLLLFVGRLTASKGLQYLLQAMPAVLERHPGAGLVVVGGGDCGDALVDMARSLGLLGRSVHFAGPVRKDELPRWYAGADCLVMPSVSEGFGLVAAEAMACGTPVVAARIPAMADIIEHGRTGFLVEPADHESLASAIIDALGRKDDLSLMARLAREALLDRLDWAVIGRGYAAILERL
jgi:glycosyltransferase involved in cell wall biosynthesis